MVSTEIRPSIWSGVIASLTIALGACYLSPSVPCGDGYCPPTHTCATIGQKETCLRPGTEPGVCGNAILEPGRGEICDDGN
ncbi:MAG TPA: hypothetical protein VNM90_02915, partial [Haliangium sp.]|nr:hypothetical protein [Haliangium sp.]